MLSGCTLPEDFKGGITQISDHTVTVRGAYNMDGSIAHPTQAMIQQAKDACPTAKYLSATAVIGSSDFFDYLFQCK